MRENTSTLRCSFKCCQQVMCCYCSSRSLSLCEASCWCHQFKMQHFLASIAPRRSQECDTWSWITSWVIAGLVFLKWHLRVCTLDCSKSASLPEADIIIAHFRGVTAFQKIKVFCDRRKNFRPFTWIQDKAMPLNPSNFSTNCSSTFTPLRWLGANISSTLLYPSL